MIKRFRFELILFVILALFVAWVWHKQEPKAPLSKAETSRYLAVIEAKFPMPKGMDRAATVARQITNEIDIKPPKHEERPADASEMHQQEQNRVGG